MALYSFKNKQPQIHSTAYIAPTAQIIGDVHIGKNSSVWFQAVVRSDLDRITIGDRTSIQDMCVCHADENIPLTIGNGITIGHRSVIHGCTIEDNCLIGMGAIVMNEAVVGKGSVVAAGAVILERTIIPPYSLVTGLPGRVKKTYENREALERSIRIMSESYMNSTLAFGSKEIFYAVER